MTTEILKRVEVPTYMDLSSRQSSLRLMSIRSWRHSRENQLDRWTPLRLYHLLSDRYNMPQADAKKLLQLMEEKSLSVQDLIAMVDEEIDSPLGAGVFTETMNLYVSYAALDHLLGKSGTKAAKSLRSKLVNTSTK